MPPEAGKEPDYRVVLEGDSFVLEPSVWTKGTLYSATDMLEFPPPPRFTPSNPDLDPDDSSFHIHHIAVMLSRV
jgi:hypothetical protein